MSDPYEAKLKEVILYPTDVDIALRNYVVDKIKNIDDLSPIYVEKMSSGLSFRAIYREAK